MVVHLAFLTFVPPPEGHERIALVAHSAPENLESFDAPGGTFEYSPDCMSEAFASSMAKMLMCYFPFVEDRGQCLGEAYSFYRVQTVGCTQPEDVEFAKNLDATPLVDADAIDLAMLDTNIEDLLEKIKKEKIEENLKGQVVDTPQPATEVRPDKYEYLAEHDNTVEKEMVKRGNPAERSAPQRPVQPEPQELRESTAPTPETAPPGGGALSMRRPGTPGAPEVESRDKGMSTGFDKVSLNGVGALRGVEAIDPMGRVGTNGTDGAGPGETGAPTRPLNLRPKEAVERALAGGTNDHLPGVEEGEYTALNTRKWKYATFFNRVKRQVAQNWHPEEAYRLRDPNGNIYGTKDRMTVLTVSIEPDGSLSKVMVTSPSGVDFLDDEAVNAFKLAEPFPNPPDALIDSESNLITFRFGFSFEINSRTPWRIFRYR